MCRLLVISSAISFTPNLVLIVHTYIYLHCSKGTLKVLEGPQNQLVSVVAYVIATINSHSAQQPLFILFVVVTLIRATEVLKEC